MSSPIGGIVSGLSTSEIITGLLSGEKAKIKLVETKKSNFQLKLKCYQSVNSLLAKFATAVNNLADKDLWNSYTTASSNSSVLTATTSAEANPGTYSFRILQLATAAQFTSSGFSDKDKTAVSPGGSTVIRIDSGKASLNRKTELATLNGGAGISRGSILITDKSGANATIDMSSALTVNDVLNAINESGLGIEATVANGALIVTDKTGGSGTLKIQNAKGGSTASDLGLVGSATGTSTTITGSNIYVLTGTTALASLRDGLGVNNGKLGSITIKNATTNESWDIDLSSAATINRVVKLIEKDTGGKVTISVGTDGRNLTVKGESGSNLTIQSTPNADAANTTAEDLGIAVTNGGESIQGAKLLADMNSVQISSLSGVNGKGINGAAGKYSQALSLFSVAVNGSKIAFDLSSLRGDDSLSDVLGILNEEAKMQLGEGKLVFAVNGAGNGLQVTNKTGYDISFEDIDGTTAADLGLSSAENGKTRNCGDLDLQYLSRATRLSNLNSGKGVDLGTFAISDASGFTVTIDLENAETLGDVIDLINHSGVDVKASINATGDGILIAADRAGAKAIKIVDVDGGTAAKDLGILGTGESDSVTGFSTINGSFETEIEIDTNDTLTDVMSKIAAATDLEASIINNGSSTNPYCLVVNGSSTGEAGDFLLDSDLEIFNFSISAQGQDSVLLYGSGANAIVLKSSTNTNDTAVVGVKLNFGAVSNDPVTITVTQDTETIADAFQAAVDTYNTLLELVNTLDQYVSKDNTAKTSSSDDDEGGTEAIKGLLFGDSTTRKMMQSVTQVFFLIRSDCGNLKSMFDLGISYASRSEDDDGNSSYSGKLTLDKDALQEWLNRDFDSVKKFMVNTKDVANSSNGASATGPLAASGSSLDYLLDGDANTLYKAENTIAAGAKTVTINFTGSKALDYLVIDHVSTSDESAKEYALRDFIVQYLNADTGEWVTAREITGNTSSKTVIGLMDTVNVSAIRITATATNASDGIMRLAGVRAYADDGLAQSMSVLVGKQTNTSTGYLARMEELMDSQISDCDDTIEDLESRYSAKESRLWTQFNAMESILSKLQSSSDYVSAIMDAWNSSKK